MTIRQAQQVLEQIERRTLTEIERGFDKVLARGLALARRQTSGPYSLAELRRRDHPYARRHGKPKLNPEIVNIQSGRLLSNWRATRLPSGGRWELRGAVINDDPVTKFLEGTRFMFPRPVKRAVEKKLAREAEAIVATALSRAMRGVL